MDKLRHINFALGDGGWTQASWTRESGIERVAYVRFADLQPRRTKPAWKLRAVELKDPKRESLADVIADIPLHRIELAFNQLDMSVELRERLNEPVGPDLERTFREAYQAAPRRKLKRPKGRRLDDDFYRQVAFAYRQAVIEGRNPVQTIADDAAVPHTTAARWIAQARAPERRYLPAATRGRVSA